MVPSDEQLTAFISAHPGSTAKQLLTLARDDKWEISEKRLRKAIPKNLEPRTRLDPTVKVENVVVKLVPGRGKGLYAAHDLLQGQVIFHEEPWITTADR